MKGRKQKIKEMLSNYFKYDDGTVITDEEIYNVVMAHSTVLERLDPAKMVYMTLLAHDMLIADKKEANAKNWHFLRNEIPSHQK
jgi:hypothetical protein